MKYYANIDKITLENTEKSFSFVCFFVLIKMCNLDKI